MRVRRIGLCNKQIAGLAYRRYVCHEKQTRFHYFALTTLQIHSGINLVDCHCTRIHPRYINTARCRNYREQRVPRVARSLFRNDFSVGTAVRSRARVHAPAILRRRKISAGRLGERYRDRHRSTFVKCGHTERAAPDRRKITVPIWSRVRP